MNDKQQTVISSFAPVPGEFHSFETGEPFSHCIDCGKPLLEDGTRYIIQKAIRGTEVIMEFAYCLECHDRLAEAYSKETWNRIWDFFLDRVNIGERREKLLDEGWTTLDPWLASCVTCGAAKSDTREYLIVGECDGRDLLFYNLPYMICENCQMKINDCLSQKSRGIWDEWVERNFDLPPSVRQDIRDGKIVLV